MEIIADGFHITSDMAKLIYKCKGSDKMCVVSDCLRASGMPNDGRLYLLGSKRDNDGQKFIVSDGVARMQDGSHYAGSIQPVSRMVKNLIVDCGIPVTEAVKMGSITPAKIIGEDKRIGSVETGKLADICLMDKDFNVVMTIVNGNIKYRV